MSPAPGRPAREAMERLVRLATVLHHHPQQGVGAETLYQVAGFDGADPGTQLAKEFKFLRQLGWQIDNIAEDGAPAVFRMTTVDNRLKLRLTGGQQSALRRAVLLADREDLVQRLGLPAEAAPDEVVAAVPQAAYGHELKTVIGALRRRCLLSYRYNGTERRVHPQSLRSQNGTWYLHGREDGSDVVKLFVVSRMSEVDAAAPGTADAAERPEHTGLHPMSWLVDPPVDVELRTPTEFAADVRRWVGTPQAEHRDGAFATLTYRVTNRAALRRRVVELGTRVEILGPDDVRKELIAELAEMAGE